jgi:hypothetical protein
VVQISAAAAPELLKVPMADCPAQPLQPLRLSPQAEPQTKLTWKVAWKTQLYSASH